MPRVNVCIFSNWTPEGFESRDRVKSFDEATQCTEGKKPDNKR